MFRYECKYAAQNFTKYPVFIIAQNLTKYIVVKLNLSHVQDLLPEHG